MREMGEVVHVELFTEKADPHGRSKGCGVVEFATYGAARRAVQQLHDSMVQGRLMYVREYYEEGSKSSSKSSTVWLTDHTKTSSHSFK